MRTVCWKNCLETAVLAGTPLLRLVNIYTGYKPYVISTMVEHAYCILEKLPRNRGLSRNAVVKAGKQMSDILARLSKVYETRPISQFVCMYMYTAGSVIFRLPGI